MTARRVILGLLVLIMAMSIGCSVYYHDPKTGEDHLWGFGHLAMKTLPASGGTQAVATRATLTGVAVGVDQCTFAFSAGWDRRERIEFFGESVQLQLERPDNDDFFAIRLGDPSAEPQGNHPPPPVPTQEFQP